MTKMRVETVVGQSGSAWFDTDGLVREFLSANGMAESHYLGVPGVTAKPRVGEDIYLYSREMVDGLEGCKFKLVRADGYRGVVIDSGIIMSVLPVVRQGDRRYYTFEAGGGRLLRWTLFCEPTPLTGDATDFRFILGSELAN